MPFAPGNNANPHGAKRTKIVEAVIRRAIATGNAQRLRTAIERQLDAAADGNLEALDWLVCRLEGKPKQQVDVQSDHSLTIKVIRSIAEDNQRVIDMAQSMLKLPGETGGHSSEMGGGD